MATYRTREFIYKPPPGVEEIRCDVCSAGIEDDQTTETEQSIITYTQTGTVWNNRDISQIDVVVKSTIPPNTNCYFCGSNRYKSGGKRGSL